MLNWNMNFNFELIADGGEHTRAINALNEDLSCFNDVVLTVALRLLQQSKPSHLNYKLIHGNMDNAKVGTKA